MSYLSITDEDRYCMTGFDLPPNFTEDPESLTRRARTHFGSPQRVRKEVDPASFVPSTSTPMAN
jgi:hypothetical protein